MVRSQRGWFDAIPTSDGSYQTSKSLRIICLLLAIALTGFSAHLVFEMLPSSPIFGDDEAISNVTFNLLSFSRYGDFVYPTASPDSVRTHNYNTYGPFYFALSWLASFLFGPDFVVLRALHPAVLAGISIGFFWSVKDSHPGIGLFLVASICFVFWYLEWPMIRPDIGVTLYATLCLFATKRAIISERTHYWAIASLAAMAAPLSHPIAAPVVFSLALTWVATILRGRLSKTQTGTLRYCRNSFVFAFAGGAFGGMIFLHATNYRIGDLLRFGEQYLKVTQEFSPTGGYNSDLFQHLNAYWSGMPSIILYIMTIGWLVAFLMVIWLMLLRDGSTGARYNFATLAPVFFTATAYHLGLGLFPNCCHAGYGIFAHVSAIWLIASLAIVALDVIPKDLKRFRLFALRFSTAIGISSCLIVGYVIVSKPPYFSLAAKQHVNIPDFIDRVVDDIPPGNSAWGASFAGLHQSRGPQLVAFHAAIQIAHTVSGPERASLAPQFLVLGPHETASALRSFIFPVGNISKNSTLDIFESLFPNQKYDLLKSVNASPYGETRVYLRRTAKAFTERQPMSYIYDNQSKKWLDVYRPVKTPKLNRIDNKVYSLEKHSGLIRTHALPTWQVELESGHFNLTFRIKRSSSTRPSSGAVVVSFSPGISDYISDRAPPYTSAPYFSWQSEVRTSLTHNGGSVYIHLADRDPQAEVELVSVTQSQSQPGTNTKDLPAYDLWATGTDKTKVKPHKNGTILLVGDTKPNRQHLISPIFRVTPNHRIRLNLTSKIIEGLPMIGVQDAEGKWIARPGNLIYPMVFEAPKSGEVRIVLANPNHHIQGRQSITVLGKASVTDLDAGTIYSDKLIACINTPDITTKMSCL